MPETVTMPQLGESVVEGTIARWLKQPGERVSRYEMIVSVVTDKVDTEIPSPAEGVMGELIAAEGDVVGVGQPICTIETEPAAAAAALAPEAPAERGAESESSPPPPPGGRAESEASPPPPPGVRAESEASPPPAPDGGTGGMGSPPSPEVREPNGEGRQQRPHLTPVVRSLAREHGVDLHQLTGTGAGGRITRRDVLEFVARRDAGEPSRERQAPDEHRQAAAAAEHRQDGIAASTAAPAPPGGETLMPLTPVRRAIAEHMVRSRQTSPHAWMMMEVDMSAAVRLRESWRDDFRRRHGVSLTFLPFVARALVESLRQHPTLNASWSDAGVVVKHDINLGIAIALEDNLIVPVIPNADRLTVTGLALAMSDLAERARSRRLSPDETRGGTFTLNNTGSLGSVLSQPIINQPQAAILAMDAIVKRPVVVTGPDGVDAIAVRSMMNLCVSFDHRINDGLTATRFLRRVREVLETIDPRASLA